MVTGGDQNDLGLVTEAAIITVTMGHQGPGHLTTTTTSAIIYGPRKFVKRTIFLRGIICKIVISG